MITDLQNAFIGNEVVQRCYQGSDLVYMSGHPDILLDWIANGADDASANPDVYFDTGFTPQLSTRAEVKFESPTLAVARVFGCGNSATASSMFNLNFYANGPTPAGSNKMSLKFFYRGGAVSAPFTPEINTPYTVSLFGTYSGNTASEINMIVNGTKYTRSVDVRANITDGQSAYIFRWHGNVNEIPAGVKFYYVKIWEANNLIRFYIPVLHYINGQYVACFYDKVNDTYIYNLGTDEVTYKISGDYLLDWIGPPQESNIPNTTGYTGFQYDTGVVASNALSVDIKGRLVWGYENNLFASATDNLSTPTWKTFGFTTSGGSTDADKCRLVFQWGAHNSSTARTFISMDSSVLVEPHKISMFFDASRGNGYLDGSLYTSSYDTWDFSPNTMYLLNRHNNSVTTTAGAGARCYYANFTTSNIPTKTIIPVLHQGKPEFLDLQTGTYLEKFGSVEAYYEIQGETNPDILLEYIANGPDEVVTRKVYFDSGVIPDASTKVEIKCACNHNTATQNVPILSGIDANWKGLSIFTPMNTKIQARIGNSYVEGPDALSNVEYTVTTFQDNTTGYLIVNGTTYSGATSSAYGTVPAYLFAYNVNGTVNTSVSYSGMKIYYLKFWDNNNLVRFYIPVLHYVGGKYVPCFYDKVNDTYIYNLGTDTPTYKVTRDTLLDYIQNGPDSFSAVGVSYDTGLDSSVNLYYDVILRTPDASIWSGYRTLMGTGTVSGTDTGKAYSHQALYAFNSNYAIYNGVDTIGGNNINVNGNATFPIGDKVRVSLNSSNNKLYAWFSNDSSTENLGGGYQDIPAAVPNGDFLLFGERQIDGGTTSYSYGGLRFYMVNFRYVNNTPAKTFIPVLHNSQPAFLDLNSANYIYNIGTDAPYYELNR